MHRPRFTFIICLLAASSASLAQTSPEERAGMAERAAERIRALQREADRLAGQSRTLFGDLRRLEIEQRINAETLAASEAALRSVTASLGHARQRVATLEARRHQATPALAAELVEIYKRGRRRHAQLLVASITDGRALGRLVRGAQALARIERARLEGHRRALRAEQEAVRELEQRVQQASRSRDAQRAARVALETSVAERNRLMEAIDRDRDVAARYAGELQSARLALERALAGRGASSSVAALPIAPFKGDLDWPVRGRIRSRFGAGQPGRSTRAGVRTGIEIAATERATVKAIHGGQVTYAAPFPGRGTLVVLDHGNGVQSLYGYLTDVSVTVGSVLDRGALVGLVGPAESIPSTVEAMSRTAEAALYFELRVDGRPVDPLQWLRSSP